MEDVKILDETMERFARLEEMEMLTRLEEQGYEDQDIDQLLQDLESYVDIPEEMRSEDAKWGFDDAVQYDCTKKHAAWVRNAVNDIPQKYWMPFRQVSPEGESDDDMYGVGIMFRSINKEIDVLVIYDDNSIEILYNVETTDESKPDEEAVQVRMPEVGPYPKAVPTQPGPSGNGKPIVALGEQKPEPKTDEEVPVTIQETTDAGLVDGKGSDNNEQWVP